MKLNQSPDFKLEVFDTEEAHLKSSRRSKTGAKSALPSHRKKFSQAIMELSEEHSTPRSHKSSPEPSSPHRPKNIKNRKKSIISSEGSENSFSDSSMSIPSKKIQNRKRRFTGKWGNLSIQGSTKSSSKKMKYGSRTTPLKKRKHFNNSESAEKLKSKEKSPRT